MNKSPEITAVICTHNRDHYLEKCINSLFNQTLDRDRYEIIVVDNASSDNTRKICDKFSDHANFRYIFESVIGLSRARNCGWQNAKGSFIGYIDDDAFAEKNWLKSALWCFKNVNPTPAGLSGPIYLEWEKANPGWITEDLKISLGKIWLGDKPFHLNSDQKIIGANCFFLKSQLQKFNGFNEQLGRKGNSLLSGEETQLQKRIEKNSGTLFYHPGVAIWHNVPVNRLTPLWFYKRYYWGGITDFFMNKSFENISRNSTHGLKPFPEIESRLNQVKRFSKNTLWSFGTGPSLNEKIWGRIYLSYCIGYLMGAAKYWQKLKLQ